MKLYKLILEETGTFPKEVIFNAALSGLANAGILAIINKATEAISNEEATSQLMFLFMVTISIYLFTLTYAMNSTSALFERILHQVRLRLTNKIRQADLGTMEGIGHGTLYQTMVQELQVISETQMFLVVGFQSVMMVIAVSLYMALLSPAGFMVTVIAIIGAASYYLYRQKEAEPTIIESTMKNIEFVDGVNELLNGFKEVKMSRERNDALYSDLENISEAVLKSRSDTFSVYNFLFIFSQCYFYFLMAVIVFLLPKLTETHQESIVELTASILFVVGPIASIMSSIPSLSKADIAVGNIRMLEARLDEHRAGATAAPPGRLGEDYREFSEIVFDNVEYAYLDQEGTSLFKVGPLSTHIKRGEILFIVGGNGSGKSTFMKLITALYLPDHGQIRLDGKGINLTNGQDYRELFSIIFAEFHLFKKLYGMGEVDEEKVKEFLELMCLNKKTEFLGDHFSRLDLSTGQKKRLALIITYLEDRPIYVFDEWAADQDPEFRQFFYTELLQELKQKGKTVIAVSHDDRYFHVADRVITMDFGTIRSDEPTPSAS